VWRLLSVGFVFCGVGMAEYENTPFGKKGGDSGENMWWVAG